jgi:cytochrome c-type biogenesis protein CcmE
MVWGCPANYGLIVTTNRQWQSCFALPLQQIWRNQGPAAPHKQRPAILPLPATVAPVKFQQMKRTNIIILVAIAVAIAALIVFSANDFSTYDTIDSAKKKQGSFVHLIAKLDNGAPIEYDPAKDANYLSFYAVDSLGGRTKVVYRNSKPTDLEKSERVVLKGKMQGDVFECKDILLKCPSKYKDDKKQLEKELGKEG